MYLIQAGKAATLAGVSQHQLREWCGRRGLLSPDVPGDGAGNHALYSWKTILTVRVVGELRSRYRVELSAWADTARAIRSRVEERSFLQLRGHFIQVSGLGDVAISPAVAIDARGGKLLVDLDPHLEALAVPLRIASDQLFSFSGDEARMSDDLYEASAWATTFGLAEAPLFAPKARASENHRVSRWR